MNRKCIDSQCIKCLLDKYADIEKIDLDNKNKTLYLKELLSIISNSSVDMTAPEITEKITILQKKYNIDAFDYSKIKKQFNDIMLSYEEEIWNKIKDSEDNLYSAICYAFTGNYIDFGAMSDITEENLAQLIGNTGNISINQVEYENIRNDLSACKSLVYITDNCGEIVFDKLLIKVIKEKFPDIKAHIIVRGKDVLNDATIDDAIQVGLDKVAPVISNGTGVAGTVISRINDKSSNLINNADIIISKGMGNFETLKGSGLNIYYMFLCKCKMFCTKFNVPKLTYMLINEKRLNL